jgi:hypothetical protein
VSTVVSQDPNLLHTTNLIIIPFIRSQPFESPFLDPTTREREDLSSTGRSPGYKSIPWREDWVKMSSILSHEEIHVYIQQEQHIGNAEDEKEIKKGDRNGFNRC